MNVIEIETRYCEKENITQYSKEKSESFGEVFTPSWHMDL